MLKNALTALGLIPLIAFSQVQPKSSFDVGKIMLPKGYKIEIYAAGIAGAREMDFAEDGTLFTGSMDEGKVYAIRPDRSIVIIDDSLELPAGLDYYNGNLYVSEISRILKYENILQTVGLSPERIVVNENFPKDLEHGVKFIRIGPDGKLYIPVGASCNVCMPDSVWHARIMRMSLDGNTLEYYAEGVRNATGFDWDPASGVLWFVDRGRDDGGENSLPDELNKAPVDGEHFGFPFTCGKLMDPAFWPLRPKKAIFTSPAFELPVQVAPSGMRFYTGEMFDEKYRGGIFIAEHGLSNRFKKTGFRISFIRIDDERAIGYEVFAAGWLQGETVWGRPADVQVGPDGSLFISDDLAGCIYRIYVQR